MLFLPTLRAQSQHAVRVGIALLGLVALEACATPGPKIVAIKSPAGSTAASAALNPPVAVAVAAPLKNEEVVVPKSSNLVTNPATKPADAASKNAFLWEVSSATNKVYLFGTIHVGRRDFYPLPKAVEDALSRSATLVVEADPGKFVSESEVVALTHYRPGDAINKHLPLPLLQRTGRLLEKFQISLEAANHMRPFMVGALISMREFERLGYEMNLGVDGYLVDSARRRGIPVMELESATAQLAMLSNLSAPLQEAFLDNAITAVEKDRLQDQLVNVVNAWRAGDAAKMLDVAKEASRESRNASELDDILLTARHPAMLNKIVTYLKDREPYFVAVGSLHLIGPKGLIEGLRARGFQVKQL